MQASQRGAAGRQFLAVGSQETHAERAQQAGAGIIGSAAAEAEDNLPRPGVQRRTDQLASATAAAARGVAAVARDQVQAAGGSHFDHCGGVVQPAPVRQGRLTERAFDTAFATFAGGGGEYRIDRAFAAVRQWPQQHLGLREDSPPAAGDSLGDVGRGQAFLERIRSNHDFHQSPRRAGSPRPRFNQSSTRLSSHTASIPAIPWTRVARVWAR